MTKTTNARRRLLDIAFAASVLSFALGGCRDEPLAIPSKPKPPAEIGGEASGGEESGGDGGAAVTGGTGGDTSTGGSSPVAGTSGSSPLAGNGGVGGTSGGGGTGGKPVNLNCGDNKPDEGEECDDGNKLSGDGCSSQCKSSCETCEEKVCPLWADDPTTDVWYSVCYEMEGTADAGPAKGVDRKVLCHDLIECVRSSSCAQEVAPGSFDFKRCFCDLDVTSADAQVACKSAEGFVPGKCARQFQEASEADNRADVYAQLTSIGRPLGAAFRLLRDCDEVLCKEECLPEYAEAPIAQISADVLSSADAAGEAPVGLLVADAQRAATNTDFAFVWLQTFSAYNDGGFFLEPTPDRAADAVGRVLASEVRGLYLGYDPLGEVNARYPSELVTMSFSGQQIYDLLSKQSDITPVPLQVSGLTYTWSATLPSGSQVVEVRKNGAAIDKAGTYTVTVDNVLGAQGAFATGQNKAVVAKLPYVVLADYLKSLPQPVAPPSGRIIKTN